MPVETSNPTQERILSAVQASHEASIEAVRRWSEAVATVAPRVPELFSTDRPEQAVGFFTKLWSNQWDYLTKLTEAATGPLLDAVNESTKKATSTAGSSARTAAANASK